jgi:hypothetical protein
MNEMNERVRTLDTSIGSIDKQVNAPHQFKQAVTPALPNQPNPVAA